MNISFRKPDCLLVRVGELALKSPPVQRRMFGILLNNIRTGLAAKKIEFKFEIMPNRIYIYTSDIRRTVAVLKKVFGIVSVSPAWVCHSHLDEIKLLAVDIAEKVLKLGPQSSFAIRPQRVGRHRFTTRTIAEEAGAAVKRVTGAAVDLSEPDHKLFIECRSRKTYIYTEKIPCAGGLPLGSAGRAIALVDSGEDVLAAWLAMKRGCELVLLTNAKPLAAKLRAWHIGRKMQTHATETISKVAEQKGVKVVIVANTKQLSVTGLVVLQPTVGWTHAEKAALAVRIG